MEKENTSSNATEGVPRKRNDFNAWLKYVNQLNDLSWYIEMIDDNKALWIWDPPGVDEELDPSQKDLSSYTPPGSMPPPKKELPSLMTAIDPLHPIVNVHEFKWFSKSKYRFTCDCCHNRFPEGAELWWRRKERVPKEGRKNSITYCKECYKKLVNTQARASER